MPRKGVLLPRPDIRQVSSEAGRPRLNRWRSGRLQLQEVKKCRGRELNPYSREATGF